MIDKVDGLPTAFRTKPSFQFFYFLPVLLALVLAVDLVLAPERNKGLMLVLVLLLAALTAPMGLAKVVLHRDRLTLHVPLRKLRTVDLRQIVDVEESARLWHRLILRYYPMDARGQPDRTTEAFLSLPPVENQTTLVERLRSAQVSHKTT